MLLDDFKDRSGNWVICVSMYPQSPIYTVSGRLWYSMNARCKPDGNVQRKHESYKGVYHTFKSFNDFSEWAQYQIGYGKDGFQFDKDLLSGEKKFYSKETAVFIPREINLFLLRPFKKSNGLPVGVYQDPEYGNYRAYFSSNGKRTHLGSFKTVDEAFATYRQHKIAVAKELAQRWAAEVDPRVCDALTTFEVLP